jgi:hypothetical protein
MTLSGDMIWRVLIYLIYPALAGLLLFAILS